MHKLLYIHGMGGGADSRIPSILSEELGRYGVEVYVRTYDFDPEIASEQINLWMDEFRPSLVVGESLGALHALRLRNVPHLFVSPALNASIYFHVLSYLTYIPGVTSLFDRIYKPREGDRQTLHFTPRVLRKYKRHRRVAVDGAASAVGDEYFFAFFGSRDHYRKSGVVSIRTWKKYFGDSFATYEGTHFMEEEFVRGMLLDKVLEILNINI